MGPLLNAYKLCVWWVVAYRILVSAPVPFGSIWVLNWIGLGWDLAWGNWGLGFGTRASLEEDAVRSSNKTDLSLTFCHNLGSTT